MTGSIAECRFYSVGEFSEIIYAELGDTLRYTSFKNNTWTIFRDNKWVPIEIQDVKKLFVEFVIDLCTNEIANLNKKYFSFVGEYEKQRFCEKIQKIQMVLNNIKQNRDKYGDSLVEECRSYF